MVVGRREGGREGERGEKEVWKFVCGSSDALGVGEQLTFLPQIIQLQVNLYKLSYLP